MSELRLCAALSTDERVAQRERERGGGRAFGEEEENGRGGDGEVEGFALFGY